MENLKNLHVNSLVAWAFVLFFCLWGTLYSVPLSKGDKLQEHNLIQFLNQHDSLVTIPKTTKYMVFANEMESSKLAHSLFSEKKEDWLIQNSIVFVSDIHKMPAVITKLIALPRMKSYPYTIHLIGDDTRGKNFPVSKSHLTIIELKDYEIQKITKVKLKKDLEEILK